MSAENGQAVHIAGICFDSECIRVIHEGCLKKELQRSTVVCLWLKYGRTAARPLLCIIFGGCLFVFGVFLLFVGIGAWKEGVALEELVIGPFAMAMSVYLFWLAFAKDYYFVASHAAGEDVLRFSCRVTEEELKPVIAELKDALKYDVRVDVDGWR